MEKLIEAAKTNRHSKHDGLMVLLAYRHGLRAAEVVDLRSPQTRAKHQLRIQSSTLNWFWRAPTNYCRFNPSVALCILPYAIAPLA
jgi:hypothetical protein